MFDIDELKEMKLLELQEIAQKIDVPKYRQLKKLDLVYQILDVQAANPKQLKDTAAASKPKRRRISILLLRICVTYLPNRVISYPPPS